MLPGGRGEEFLIIAVIALIVVGPKDLPKMLRQLGRFVGKMRNMADEFRSSFEDMARQSELDDLRKEVEAMRSGQTPSILADVHRDMKAIESDVNNHVGTFNSDTQMRGYDPMDSIPPVTPSAPQPVEAPVKKPRAKKPKPEPKPVVAAEPLVEPTVKPAKRAPRKKSVS